NRRAKSLLYRRCESYHDGPARATRLGATAPRRPAKGAHLVDLEQGSDMPESGGIAKREAAGGAGEEIAALIARLYPICRSITGPGVRETRAALAEIHPTDLVEVPTGTKVFDWTVPRE